MASMMTCRVHPVVVLSMVDAHERRPVKEAKALGTLLGWYDKRVVELTSCYSVPFSEENDEPQIDISFNNDLYGLHQRSGSEIPVGWFSTSAEVGENALNYHDYYSEFSRTKQEKREQVPVVLLTVDGALKGGRMEIKAFLRNKAGVPGSDSPHCALFIPIAVELALFQPEETALSLISQGMGHHSRQAHLSSGLAQLRASTKDMLGWLSRIRAYVDDVLAGKLQPDPQIGRRLMALVTAVAKIPPAHLEDMLNNSVKDQLMLTYLAQLAKTQLSLHEKMLTV